MFEWYKAQINLSIWIISVTTANLPAGRHITQLWENHLEQAMRFEILPRHSERTGLEPIIQARKANPKYVN